MWEELDGDSVELSSTANEALEALFEVKPSAPARRGGRAGDRPGGGAGGAVVKVLALPRANNISIMLTQVC